MFSIFSYGYGTQNTKKIDVLATHVDGVTPKTPDSHYARDIMYYFDNPEKTPFNFIMGDTLDQREYFRDYRSTQKRETIMGSIYYVALVCLGPMLEI